MSTRLPCFLSVAELDRIAWALVTYSVAHGQWSLHRTEWVRVHSGGATQTAALPSLALGESKRPAGPGHAIAKTSEFLEVTATIAPKMARHPWRSGVQTAAAPHL